MIKNEQLSLIEGTFLQEDAKEIVTNIFSEKINFHQLKNFSSQERFGIDDETAIRRIPQLKKELQKLEKFLSDPAAQHNKLFIQSVIHISIVEE